MAYNHNITDKGRIDGWIISMYLLFVVLGWLNIYAASYDLENAVSLYDLSGRAGSQLLWIGSSFVLAFALMKIDFRFYDTYAYVFYAIGLFLLIITLFLAPDIKGSHSWLVMGSIRLQPAEFMKFIIALALAKTFSAFGFELMKFKNFMIASSLILLPVLLVIMQSETGTALVYLSFIFVLYREGLPGGFLFMGVATMVYFVLGIRFSEIPMGRLSQGEFLSVLIIILFSAGMIWSYAKRKGITFFILSSSGVILLVGYFLSRSRWIEIDFGLLALIAFGITLVALLYFGFRYWKRIYFLVAVFAVGSFLFLESVQYVFSDVMQPHQQMRIKVTLGMEKDLQGSGYHTEQSKIAIGSGALFGKGFLNGTQTKLKYVPEQDTDFIFCTIGEEHGFVGASMTLLLFMIFILRLIHLAERQPTIFGRVYGYSVVSIFLFHLLVNIGMVVGILPVIGIPLPFFSYGGSSLWGFTILLFIFLRIDKARKPTSQL